MKKALTMGELLVTMTVIGTIAILVLPGISQNYQYKVYSIKVRKVYESLSVAVNKACVDSNVAFFLQTPYYDTLGGISSKRKDFVTKYLNKSNAGSGFNSKYSANGNPGTEISSIDDCSTNNATCFALKGGESVSFKCSQEEGKDPTCQFVVDINGKAAPNMAGRDYFVIPFNPNNNEFKDKKKDDKGKEIENEECSGTDISGCFNKLRNNNWDMSKMNG